MGKIKLLPQDLINQIAAGEVVERPASVAKELIENSLDAGADNIIIEAENGGLNLLRVIDNGCGMDREDAIMSLQQHATSKIVQTDDLFRIGTLGFRGEALASIAAVSEFELVTKEKTSLAGTKITFANGEMQIVDAGAQAGTTVTVKNLFYNIPARRKYLKTATTEFNHIVDLFLAFSVLFPKITWRLNHNGRPVYHFPQSGDQQRLADALGAEVAGNLIEVDTTAREIRIQGFLSKPQIARNNRKLQYLSVNGRPVSEYVIAKQIKDAYGTLLAKDLYPVYVLQLTVNTEKVDVNVHPRKLEVRFSEPHLIYQSVYQAAGRVLDNFDLTKTLAAPTNFEKPFAPINQIIQKKTTSLDFNKSFSNYSPKFSATSPATPNAGALNFTASATVQSEKIIGQVKNCYIVAESMAGLKIYDQHACSERVRYEQMKKQWAIGTLASQKMLIPLTIEVSPAEAAMAEASVEPLLRLGFEMANVGGHTYMISSVPQFLIQADIKAVTMEIIGALSETTNSELIPEGPIDRSLKLIACRGAIKFGDKLTLEGMEALIRDFSTCENKYSCIHGRPAVVEMSEDELLKLFAR